MNPVEKTNIKALAETLSAACKQETKFDTTADFISALHPEPDKKREKNSLRILPLVMLTLRLFIGK